jgi:2-C-methyl-D-erythritol 4-phosphate cytidylyltransferase
MAGFHVLIPAAGSGSRMESAFPKQYLMLNGKALIQHVVELFERTATIVSIHVILSPQDSHWETLNMTSNAKLTIHHCGGGTRAETVLNGLKAIESQLQQDDWVLVHDAARPGLSDAKLHQLLDALKEDDIGGLLAIPLADTLKRADATGYVAATVPRTALWQAQTPQMFRYATLKHALESFPGSPTDEAEAIEALGLKPKLVNGELRNLKVTYVQDLAVLTALLATA